MITDKKKLTLIRTYVTELLREGVIQVEFTKKDGSQRTMNCTLDFEIIPEEKHPTTSPEVSETVIVAYDTDIGEWRAFRVASVLSFKVTLDQL